MNRTLVIIAGCLAMMLVVVGGWLYKNQRVYTGLSRPPAHGVVFTLKPGTPAPPPAEQIAQLKEAIIKRFTASGTPVYWERVSDTEYRVHADLTDPEAIETAGPLVSRQTLLELRFVHPDSETLMAQGRTEEGYELLTLKAPRTSPRPVQRYLVNKKAEGGPSGIQIASAFGVRGSAEGSSDINFKLTSGSGEAFKDITRTNIGRQLAIVVNGDLLAAPVIRAEIPQGMGVISGQFNKLDAFRLASWLESPLPFRVELVETKRF